MALKRSLVRGFVAFVAATFVARAVGSERLGTRVGLLTGVAVAVSTWLSADRSGTTVELEAETNAAE